MAGSKCSYLSKAILDHTLGKTLYVPPNTIYVALSLNPFDPTSTGSAMDEIATASYARVALTNDGTQFSAASLASPATKSNVADIDFVNPGEDWGTPQSVYLVDAQTQGNCLYGADVSATDVSPGNPFKIVAGTFIFSED